MYGLGAFLPDEGQSVVYIFLEELQYVLQRLRFEFRLEAGHPGLDIREPA